MQIFYECEWDIHVDKEAKEFTTGIYVWNLYFTNKMIEKTVNNTNICIEKNKQNFCRESDCKMTTPSGRIYFC